ncbi:MAG: hypothetical protein KF708_07270 [Pirellulales bacterium]|nr:hypothetical protein [Pirellulales bacterium]
MSILSWRKRAAAMRRKTPKGGALRGGESLARGRRTMLHEPLEARQLLAVSPLGNQFQVNPASSSQYVQLLARPSQSFPDAADGSGVEARNQAVAVDHDGDFVVVWTSYLDQDGNGQDGDGAGVYMRMFNRQGVAITDEVQVNTFTEGDQRNASVAMDADGDFVIVWESSQQDAYDGSAGIYAQRFNSRGQKVGAEFQVHATTMHDQLNPAVAMNADGQFVIAWETRAQDFSFFNDVRGQLFNFNGERIGNEFLVNDINIPSYQYESNPAIAMSRDGHFVIVWEGDGKLDGLIDSDILGRVYSPSGLPIGTQFTVNVSSAAYTTTFGPGIDIENIPPQLAATQQTQRNAAIAMDADGNFVVVWESFQDNDVIVNAPGPESFGIYFRRFILNPAAANGATPASPVDSRVNVVLGDPTQDPFPINPFWLSNDVHPTVAMDADGDFVIAFEGQGAYDLFGYTDFDSRGIWMVRYHAAAVFPAVGANNTTNAELPGSLTFFPQRVNTTTAGIQRHPSMAMEPDGDFIIVWDGSGPGDTQGIFGQRFNESTDTAGALVTDVYLNGKRLKEGDQVIEAGVSQVAVIFDEQLSIAGGATGTHSVLNPNNWSLFRDGTEVLGGVRNVSFSLDPATNKWTAIVTLDSDGPLGPPGSATPLVDGNYVLIARRTIRDVVGNPLQSRGSVTLSAEATKNGFDFVRNFNVTVPISVDTRVNTTTNGAQSTLPETGKAVARDGDGNYVVVWSGNGTQPGQADSQGVFFQLYDRDGTPIGGEIRINTIATGTQSNAAVAMDTDGDFVVTWSSYGHDATSGWDVFARRFDARGNARDATEFRVNSTVQGIQRFPTVAMDVDGDFVVAWQSYLQDGSGYGIYAQRYTSAGERLGGVNEQQRIRILGEPTTGSFRLRLGNDAGAPVTALITYSTTDRDDVTAQKIEDALRALGIEVEVDARSSSEFAVTFIGKGGSLDRPQLVPVNPVFVDGTNSTVAVNTTIPGVSGEFRVNETTFQNQRFASAAADAFGNFVITWTSNAQDGDLPFDTNIYYRRFSSSGTPLSGELRVNVNDTINVPNTGLRTVDHQSGSQMYSRVAMDANGDFVITWTSYGTDGSGNGYGPGVGGQNGVFARRFRPDGTDQTVAHPVTNEQVRIFRVNTFTDGNQQYSSISMTPDGTFVIVWESYQDDGAPVNGIPDSFGVYAQRYAPNEAVGSILFGRAGEIGSEFRVNSTIVGDQRFPSVAIDHQGSYVVVWTSVGQDGSGDGIYARRFGQRVDVVPPTVADGFAGGAKITPNQPVDATNITEIVITFSEEMSTEGGDTGFNSVLNPDNWFLFYNGGLLTDVIVDITFGFNPSTGKWEARLYLDGDVSEPGIQPLLDGDYTLVISDRITDVEGNFLDGNYDGLPGGPFAVNFSVLPEQAQAQIEFPVNSTVPGAQRTGGSRTVAVDADGDFVVVWTSYGQDGDASSQGNIYVQRFTRDGVPLGGEFRVNSAAGGDQSFSVGHQNAPSIAIDADGDFIVVWSGFGRDGDLASESNIYARRFNSSGVPQGNPFLVNQTIGGTQREASVAVDVDGDFFIVWSSSGQDGSGYGIYTRAYNSAGQAVTNEARVNVTTAGNQQAPVVAMGAQGSVVFAWTTPDLVGIGTDIVARLLLPDGSLSTEFIVNSGTATNPIGRLGVQKSPAIGIDLSGDFVIAWSSAGQDGSGYGIFAQRYNAAGVPQGVEFQANVSVLGNQEMPSVSLDHDGDFIIAWSGNGTQADSEDQSGVFARRFAADGTPLAPPLGADGVDEFRVNTTIVGTQQFASVGVDGEGDFVIAWSGAGIGESGAGASGVFARLFNISGDNAGPIVTDVQVADAQLKSGTVMTSTFLQMKVIFSERLSQVNGNLGFDSVTNPANWSLSRNGVELPGAITHIEFGLNSVTQKWEAILSLDGNGFAGGTIPLEPGAYMLTVRDFIADTSTNFLDGNYDGLPGLNYNHFFTIADLGGTGGGGQGGQPVGAGGEFVVNTTFAGTQNQPAVAMDGAGNFVAVWRGPTTLPSSADPTIVIPAGATSVFFQLFDAAGNKIGTEQQIIESAAVSSINLAPAVARDRDGNFMIVWTGSGPHDSVGIYAQPFTPTGTPRGAPFLVNTFTQGLQFEPAIDMGPGGDFVISWTSSGQDGDLDGVYAQRYGSNGSKIGGEFRVNSTSANRQDQSRVALDHNGNFVIIWESFAQDGSSWGIFGQRYNAAAQPVGGEFSVNTTTNGPQRLADVAMDADGDFVVTWQSLGQDGSGYGIYARRFTRTGGAGDEFRVNATTLNYQQTPSIAMDAAGNFTIVWTSFGHDEDGNGTKDGNGIYARSYRADGIEVTRAGTNTPLGEYHINERVEGDQTQPAIAMDSNGNFVVIWTGQDATPIGTSTGIFGKRFRVSAAQTIVGVGSSGAGQSGGTSGNVPVNSSSGGSSGSSAGSSNAGGSNSGGGNANTQVAPPPTEMTVNGTTGFDLFEFIAGPTLASSTLRLNGKVINVPQSVTSFRLNGFGGGDRVVINGSDADEIAELWAGTVKFRGSGYEIVAADMPNISVFGNGGKNTMIIHGSSRSEVLTMTASRTTLAAPGVYSNEGYGFAHTEVYSGGGNDQARLFDTPGNDVLTASASSVRLRGAGYDNRAYGFAQVETTASVGNDVAVMYGSAGNDVLIAAPGNTRLYGAGFDNRAYGFRQIEANSSGGKDFAQLYDSAGNDVLMTSPSNSRLYGASFDHRVYGFNQVESYSRSGNDVAFMYDSAGNDVMMAAPKNVRMNGANFDNRAYGFSLVETLSANGNDVARMYDSIGNDVLLAAVGNVRLWGGGFDNRAYGFRQVEGYSNSGNDTALMYDSAGDDTLTAAPRNVRFVGNGFDNRAIGFAHVESNSRSGLDTAMMYDSAGNDTFISGVGTAQLKGVGFDNRAYGFRKVQAIGSGGVDSASMYGSQGANILVADLALQTTRLTTANVETVVERFAQVMAQGSGTSLDQATLIDSVLDDTLIANNNLAQVSNARTTGQFYNFKNVKAQGGQGGQNSVTVNSIDYVLENHWS